MIQIDVKILSNFPLSKFLRSPLCLSDEDFTGYLHRLRFYLQWLFDHLIYKVIYARDYIYHDRLIFKCFSSNEIGQST